MKTKFLLSIAVAPLSLYLRASAQSPTPDKPPLPPDPLVLRMPDYSKWTITATDQSKSKQSSAKPGSSPASTASKRDGTSAADSVTTITKTMPTMLVATVGSKTDNSNIWCIGIFQVHQDAEFEKPKLLRTGSEAATYIDFSRSDFPELQWINAGNYIEARKSADRVYQIFRDKIPKTTEENINRARAKAAASKTAFDEAAFYYIREACVDAQTKLPAYWRAGTVYHIYKFEEPPTEMLRPPENIATMIEREQSRLRDLARRPPAG